MRALHTTIWTLIPASSFVVDHLCARCGQPRPLVCTDHFRVNAHRRRLDVWLLFRCPSCEDTVRLPVLERVPVRSIQPATLDAFHGNDAEEAARRAVRLGARCEVRVEGRIPPPPFCATVSVPEGVQLRLDRLLAMTLQISRSRVVDLDRAGRLRVEPTRRLRARVRDGDRITVLG